jgi:hypothetical protein
MSRLLIILLATAGIAHAECYTRSSAISRAASRIERMTDLEQTLMPAEGKQVRCRVTFRALIDSQWHTAEGDAVGPSGSNPNAVCAQALNTGRSSILVSVAGSNVTMNQELICTDQAIPTSVPVVNIGDTVKDSQVQPHPIHRSLFPFRGSLCRWFIESRPGAEQVDMSQGIICRARDQTDWRVVDKW